MKTPLKRLNSRKKGRKNELKAEKILLKEGWDTVLVSPGTKFSKRKDFFKLFDAIAVKGNAIRFIQVKTNKDDTGKKWKEEAAEFLKVQGATVEVWVFRDRVTKPRIKLL